MKRNMNQLENALFLAMSLMETHTGTHNVTRTVKISSFTSEQPGAPCRGCRGSHCLCYSKYPQGPIFRDFAHVFIHL